MNINGIMAAAVLISAIAGVGSLLASRSDAADDTTVAALSGSTHFHGLAVDQNDPSRLYLATHHGLYVVAGDGSAKQVSETTDDFMGFTPHPTDPMILYASGHPKGGGNLGFITSKDGGRSWEKLSDGSGGPVDFHQMDVSRSNPNVIYGVHGGLQRSVDGGQSWHKIGAAPDKLIDLAIAGKDEDTLYAATQAGLIRSTDGGRNWLPMHPAKAASTMVHVTSDGKIYAYIIGNGLLRADEAELDWQLVNPMIDGRYLLHFAVDPKEGRNLYAVTYDPSSRNQSIVASRDGGRSWNIPGR